MTALRAAKARFRRRGRLRLEPVDRIRFTYPESSMVDLEGGWQKAIRQEGRICGRLPSRPDIGPRSARTPAGHTADRSMGRRL
jgi:hypothetical protein